MRRTALPVLVFAGLLLTASGAAAQGRSSAAAAEGADYRLTMPILRKALPVLSGAEAEKGCRRPREEGRDVRSMSVAEMVTHLKGCPVARSAAADRGLSLRDLALVSKAIMLASYRMATEESAKVSGGTAAPLSPGALRDNVALLRQNEAELERLSKSQ
jgi:hypothetical protein